MIAPIEQLPTGLIAVKNQYLFIIIIVISMKSYICLVLAITAVWGQQILPANISCTSDCCKSLKDRAPMTYYFYQNTGKFEGGSGEYAVNTAGYSGQGKGYLNPDYQCVQNTGPLPATIYKLESCVNLMHKVVKRPCSFYLAPQKEDEMCGRNAFFIHGCDCCTTGDDSQPPAPGCSAGCIVIDYRDRKKLRIGDTLIVHHYEPQTPTATVSQSIADRIQVD